MRPQKDATKRLMKGPTGFSTSHSRKEGSANHFAQSKTKARIA